MKITKPVFIPSEAYKHSSVTVSVGRRQLKLTKHMVGEEYRRLEELGYAVQVGTIDVEVQSPPSRAVAAKDEPAPVPEPVLDPVPEHEFTVQVGTVSEVLEVTSKPEPEPEPEQPSAPELEVEPEPEPVQTRRRGRPRRQG